MSKAVVHEAIYTISEKVVPRKIKDKLIIVPIEDGVADFNNAMFAFNDTGARIWECIEKKMSVDTICDTLAEEYHAERNTIVEGVENLIVALLEKGIVEEWKN